MKKVIAIWLCFLGFLYFKDNVIMCQTFHPIAYASHRLYSGDKVVPHELRNDIKEHLNNFLIINVKTFLDEMSMKTGIKGFQLQKEYEESLVEQIKSLLQQAKNKKMLSAKIQRSYDKALRDLKRRGNENNIQNTKHHEILKHNLEQIHYLNNRIQYLEEKAQHLQEHLKEIKNGNNAKNFSCTIQKKGKLNFVSSASGLKHSVDNVIGQLDGTGLSIYHKKQKKITYYWNLIDMPVKVIGNIDQCFSFLYKNTNQILCTKNKIQTASWINAIAEGFFCYHFGIKGIAVNPNIDNSQIMKKTKKSNNLTVDIIPEEKSTRISIDDVEHEIQDNEVFDVGKMKREMELELEMEMEIKKKNNKFNESSESSESSELSTSTKSMKSNNSSDNISEELEESDNFEEDEKLEKSEKSEKSDNFEKDEKLEKLEKSENFQKYEKQEESDKKVNENVGKKGNTKNIL